MAQAQTQAIDPQQLAPTDLRHPDHPRYEMYARVRGALATEYDRWGLMRDPAQLDRETAQVVVEAHKQRIDDVGGISLSFPQSSTRERPMVTLVEHPTQVRQSHQHRWQQAGTGAAGGAGWHAVAAGGAAGGADAAAAGAGDGAGARAGDVTGWTRWLRFPFSAISGLARGSVSTPLPASLSPAFAWVGMTDGMILRGL